MHTEYYRHTAIACCFVLLVISTDVAGVQGSESFPRGHRHHTSRSHHPSHYHHCCCDEYTVKEAYVHSKRGLVTAATLAAVNIRATVTAIVIWDIDAFWRQHHWLRSYLCVREGVREGLLNRCQCGFSSEREGGREGGREREREREISLGNARGWEGRAMRPV